jgi:glutamate dehydrogenase
MVMANKSIKRKQTVIDELYELVSKKLPADQAKLVHVFIKQYYTNVSLEDLESHDPLDLFGATLSHWNLLYQRLPGENKIRIYNP